MPATHRNRLVTAISNTPGASGALTIAAAASGYRTFGASDDGLSFDVSIVDGTAWEIRTGCVYTHTGTSLSRGTLEDSSTGSAIALTSAAVVTVTLSAGMGHSLVKQINPGSVYANNDGTTIQSIANSTFTRLTAITTEVFDQLGWYNAAIQRFQPTRSGIYLVGMGAQVTLPIASIGASASVIALIRKNGTDYAHLARGWVTQDAVDSAKNVGVSGSCLVHLNGSSDYVEPFLWQNDTASRNTVAGAERQFFFASFWGE